MTTNIEKRLNDIRYKITIIKENRNNKYKYPREILITLSKIELELEDNLYSLKAKTDFSF